MYCNHHKLDKMVNVRKGYSYCERHNKPYLKFCKECEQVDCLLCEETVNKSHFFSKKHIDKVNNNISVKMRTSLKKKFIDIIIDFHIIDKDVFYKDLYFKDKVKSLILKHREKDKNYKINLYKYNQSSKGDLTNFYIEKFNIDNVNEIDNIEKLNLKNFKHLKCFDFDSNNLYGRPIELYDGTIDPENINIISEDNIEYDASQMKIIQNTRLLIKLSECNILSSGSSLEIKKIPEIFFNKKNLAIIKNLNDHKCFLWCYIHKFLNPIEKNISRIDKKDIEISKELIDEYDIDFEDVSLDEIDNIEDLLECNVHVFGCDKKLNSKKILKGSLKNHDKYLDLLLIDGINHYILIKNFNLFIGDNSIIVETCRNCLNVFYSESKYEFHLEYCKTREAKKLMPSFKKYLQFENLKNCIESNWLIHSDFECIIDPITKEHKFISEGYLVECKNQKYSKNIQSFYNLEEYTRSLYNELKYIEETEEEYLNNPIDYTNFNQNEFDNTLECKYCKCKFNDNYNDRIIILNEIVDKEKLKYILDNNDFNLEVNNIAKNYYDSLDKMGRKRVIYRQKVKHKDRYYGVGSCLTYLKKEIRNSILANNVKDVDMVNAHPVILLNLCEKNKVKYNILKNYIENRNLILSSFGDSRASVKKLFLSILNGGFKHIYSEDNKINNYLKLFETEIIKIQKYFYSKDKRYFEKGYNHMGKNLSRIILDIENQILQVIINDFLSKRIRLLTIEYDGVKIYSDDKSKHFSITQLERIVLEKTGVNMKMSFKEIIDAFPEFKNKASTDNIIDENIIENKVKVIHHDHCLERDNVLDFICRECNLQIKNNKAIPLYFFNGSRYDNSLLLRSLCDIYKNEIIIKCIGDSAGSFKCIQFKFKNMKYSFKLLDISNFIKGSLLSLSENLSDEYKIITKRHFPDNFELLKEKTCFPYEWLNNQNLYDKELPPIDKFYSSLKLQNISQNNIIKH